MADNMEKKLHELAESIKTDDSFAAEVLDRIESNPETSRKINLNRKNLLGKFIMQSKFTKLAAAAAIIIAALIGINYFGGSIDGANIAFADVLKHVQGSSYSFDLTMSIIKNGQVITKYPANRCSVLGGTGRVRFDSSEQGLASTVLDLSTGKGIILFHQQKSVTTLDEPKITGDKSLYGLLSKSVSNLWDMRDGTEQDIGKKKIDGRQATGFKVAGQKEAHCAYEIEIWADTETSEPLTVEITGNPLDKSNPTIKWNMANFKVGAKLDKKDFSLSPPTGYVHANQKSLDEVKSEKKQSPQGQKIANVLELWSNDSKKEAIDTLLSVDWSAPMEFSSEQYIFTMTEKDYISLKTDEQQKVMKKVWPDCSKVGKIVKEALRLGQIEVEKKDYRQAERYYLAGQKLGKQLAINQEGMLIVRAAGIGAQIRSLKEMVKLHKASNERAKLEKASTQLAVAESSMEELKKEARGQ